ncbi:MAG: sugar transferase [Actinobacteria bacterium]|nr:sugar transferase [Actinomycetota bacterium]
MDQAREPSAAAEALNPPGPSLAERYAQIAHEYEPRSIDTLLRALDVAIAGGAVATASPVLAAVAAAVRITSGAPVLYRGRRVGRAGRVFTMYKFRTLAPDAESRLGPYLGDVLSRRTEDEVTPIGRLLRATYVDELPQLWNVLRGDMSLVGPRPIRPTFFEELCEQIPQYWQRLVVRPGMTGFAQMRLSRDQAWSEKLAHDFEYIADRSVHLYARVLMETGWRVVKGVFGGRGRPPLGAPPPPSPSRSPGSATV